MAPTAVGIKTTPTRSDQLARIFIRGSTALLSLAAVAGIGAGVGATLHLILNTVA